MEKCASLEHGWQVPAHFVHLGGSQMDLDSNFGLMQILIAKISAITVTYIYNTQYKLLVTFLCKFERCGAGRH